MNVLFLSLLDLSNLDKSNIYSDLIKTLGERGCKVTIVSPYEKKYKKKTELYVKENFTFLKVKTGNITQTKNKLEKGISTLLIEYQFLFAIKKYLRDTKYDLVLYSTPPITFNKIVKYIKKRDNSQTYLMLKDIFPQNAVDLGMFSKNSLIYKIFKKKENNLYKISDTIGCMSLENKNYILSENDFINKEKVEIFPNSLIVKNNITLTRYQRNEIREKFNIPSTSIVFVYGGNLGKPQGIDFLIKICERFNKFNNAYLLIIGDGTEYDKLEKKISNLKYPNVAIYKRIDEKYYDELLKATDVGLIFLDPRFTIPNFPSRILSYMGNAMPILAATDSVTDVGKMIIESRSGYWVKSGNLEVFLNKVDKFVKNPEIIEEKGLNARRYFEDNFDIEININKILEKVEY